MEVKGHFPGLINHDVVGQPCIKGDAPAFDGNSRLCMEMRHLSPGMHTGISTPGTMQLDGLPSQQPDRRFQVVLDGIAAGLSLEAIVASTVVADHQGYVPHMYLHKP
ncbi:hypothetical protein D3C75_985560 [compost metagenome]